MQSNGNGSFQWSSSDDEDTHEVSSEAGTIPDCEGIPRRLWMTKVVTVHSDDDVPVVEGICYSINSDLVLDCNGPMGDSHVAVQISKSLCTDHVPDEWRYSLHGPLRTYSTAVLVSKIMKFGIITIAALLPSWNNSLQRLDLTQALSGFAVNVHL